MTNDSPMAPSFHPSPLKESRPHQPLCLNRYWYAVFTTPQNEKSAARHLHQREVEFFLPTYEEERVWRNRQRVKVNLPLFPSYLFVRIAASERGRVLQVPGILRIVGNSREGLPLPDSEINFLRLQTEAKALQPFRELAEGQRVRVRTGIMQGIEGVLVRKSNRLRFVISLALIDQHAAMEVNAHDLEAILN